MSVETQPSPPSLYTAQASCWSRPTEIKVEVTNRHGRTSCGPGLRRSVHWRSLPTSYKNSGQGWDCGISVRREIVSCNICGCGLVSTVARCDRGPSSRHRGGNRHDTRGVVSGVRGARSRGTFDPTLRPRSYSRNLTLYDSNHAWW